MPASIEDQIALEAQSAMKTALDYLRTELATIRGNRPSIELVEHIQVSSYDQMLSIQQLAAITIVPPSEIHISPWDKTTIPAITKAIEEAKIGLSVSANGDLIRARLSSLGEERRQELLKTVKKTAESARIQIRARRDEAMKKIKSGEEEKTITKDRAFKLKDRVQKIVDDANEQIEMIVEKKNQEIGE